MKRLKIAIGLVLIPLGVFVGSYIHLGGGTGALLGGILGAILCCLLLWFVRKRPGLSNLDERHRINHSVDGQTIDMTIKSVQDAQIEGQIRRQQPNLF